jgi:hypothetical protein
MAAIDRYSGLAFGRPDRGEAKARSGLTDNLLRLVTGHSVTLTSPFPLRRR